MSVKAPYLSLKAKTLQSLNSPNQSNFDDLKIISPISQAKPYIFLAHSESQNKNYVLKTYQTDVPSSFHFYHNEARFSSISHPNIIQILNTKTNSSSLDKRIQDCPFILMELAPYGNFAELVGKGLISKDEKLVRTFFHQLIHGVEYLHLNNIAHMDLKLGNLLLGDDYLLKICDFEFSYKKDDSMIFGNGTKNFRSPEIREQRISGDLRTSDIYSLGIILFTMITGGFPYDEEMKINGYDLFYLLLNNINEFWEGYNHCMKKSTKLSDEFKELFEGIVKKDPKKRWTLNEIKSCRWYQMSTYSREELRAIMSKRITSCVN